MIIVLKQGISSEDKAKIESFLKEKGFLVKEIVGASDTVIGAVGSASVDPRSLELMNGVSKVIPISKPYKLASRELKKEDTIVSVGRVKIGGNRVSVIAGPCAVESYDQIMRIAEKVRESGAVMLRGGAFKPRTSPYAFQGLGEEGLKLLRRAGDEFEMPITSECVSPNDVEMMSSYVDMFQIGARNMQNFELLKRVGKTGMPVLLKRGISATIEEWLMAAEYLMSSGTDQIVLCERGIRTYERATRNTLDCSAVPVIQKLTHLPIIGDPSHATGIRDMVSPMALALIASGASGLIVEVHDNPDRALSDGPQSLYPEQFEKLVRDIEALSPVIGKSLEKVPFEKKAETFGKNKPTGKREGSFIVAFQGERGAFSELAAKHVFGEDVSTEPSHSFKDVFEKVSSGDAKYGIIPIENTLGGTINDNIDLLMLHPEITVVGEEQVRVVHNLIGLPGSRLEDIKEVYSHPQALSQCRRFLESELPSAEAISYYDTAGAVEYIKKRNDKSMAAIAGRPAASHYSMEIIRESIETNPSNYTRFYVITRDENADLFRSQAKINKSALSFDTKDEPGALLRILEIINGYGLNMKKLESRPIQGKPWQYHFFVEVEVDTLDNLREMEGKIKDEAPSFRELGVFSSII